MTGNEVYKQALTLLNYTTSDGTTTNDADLHKRALPLINQIYADLWSIDNTNPFIPLSSLTQAIPLEDFVLYNVFPYGVAMLIAQTEGDGDNNALYSSLYNQRRSSARTQTARFVDKLPKVYF